MSAPASKPAVAAKSMAPPTKPISAAVTPKRPWWKFWAKKEVVAAPVTNKVKLPPQPDLVSKSADLPKPAAATKRVIPPIAKPKGEVKYVAALPQLEEDVRTAKRHQDLVESIQLICKGLENSKDLPKDFSTDVILPPIPVEKIEQIAEAQGAQSEVLKSINNGQDKISGVLDQMGLSISQAAEKAAADSSRISNSITQVDGSVGALRKVSEKSLTSIDHMSGVIKTVESAVKGMQGEVDKSTKAYDELFEKSKETEKAHADEIAKLQMRSLWVNVLLGLGIVGGIAALVLNG